ncbi:LptA/OstA family protein [Devosia rhodophyticola]|uniref:LptA/OstA family protein n=1 Tax=Devosia rhodophyticola TaxID=3026423 RepID=A0ABY7Z0P5_9HYPH|nr:LptA/OstA family protein [Devosia rhodophyticola]WDR07223.1 LptA/OstA family protein [Devosia rhodophyticola]
MKKLAAIALLALLTVSPALAVDKVQISADLFTVAEGNQQAVFTGNVIVVHPSVKVWADKVTAIYGEGGTTDIKSFVATGKVVRLKTDEQDATGEKAVFTPGDQLLRLTGNVVVTNSSGTVNANELVVNLETNVSTFTGTNGGRVTGVFNAQ